jgi:hypothetical protein
MGNMVRALWQHELTVMPQVSLENLFSLEECCFRIHNTKCSEHKEYFCVYLTHAFPLHSYGIVSVRGKLMCDVYPVHLNTTNVWDLRISQP